MRLTKRQILKIKEIGKNFNLRLLMIYGSFAKGTPREGSDLDIAVLGRVPIDLEVYFTLYSALSDVFDDLELDLVLLEKKDPLFLYQVAKNSQLLYGNLTDYNEFRAFAFRNYLDSQDLSQLEKTLVLKYQDHLNKIYAR